MGRDRLPSIRADAKRFPGLKDGTCLTDFPRWEREPLCFSMAASSPTPSVHKTCAQVGGEIAFGTARRNGIAKNLTAGAAERRAVS